MNFNEWINGLGLFSFGAFFGLALMKVAWWASEQDKNKVKK